jgi:hypothetical protein
MNDNQTHAPGASPPPLFDKVIATINASNKIQSLLYDLGLLPEQTSTDPLNWSRTGSIALEIAERDERIRMLEHEVRDANAIIAAMKDDYNRRPENEPIGMLLDVLSTRPRNIINIEMSMAFPGEKVTLGHLCKFARSEVLKFPNLGKKSLREIEEYMRPRGVWWRGEQ